MDKQSKLGSWAFISLVIATIAALLLGIVYLYEGYDLIREKTLTIKIIDILLSIYSVTVPILAFIIIRTKYDPVWNFINQIDGILKSDEKEILKGNVIHFVRNLRIYNDIDALITDVNQLRVYRKACDIWAYLAIIALFCFMSVNSFENLFCGEFATITPLLASEDTEVIFLVVKVVSFIVAVFTLIGFAYNKSRIDKCISGSVNSEKIPIVYADGDD